MDSLMLSPGMIVKLEIIDRHGENESVLSLVSAIEEIIGDKHLLIHEPTHLGQVYHLPKHATFLMSVNNDLNRHVLQVRYLESLDQGELILLKVERLGHVEYDQRRSCFRISFSTPVKIGLPLFDEDGKKLDLMHVTKAHTIDLSDSGLLFSTDEHFKEGHELHIEMDIGMEGPLIGSVIRTQKTDRAKFKHDVAVKLKHNDKHQKDYLYKYLVKKQLEMRHYGSPHNSKDHS